MLSTNLSPYSNTVASGEKNSPHCISELVDCLTASPLRADHTPALTAPGLNPGPSPSSTLAGHCSSTYAKPDVEASDANTHGSVTGARQRALPFQASTCSRQ